MTRTTDTAPSNTGLANGSKRSRMATTSDVNASMTGADSGAAIPCRCQRSNSCGMKRGVSVGSPIGGPTTDASVTRTSNSARSVRRG
jgi:hypothetical protein